ncbi:ankyrin [Penicillium canariense]|uniref:Ankyrin n=1 Tax=Penicillium canariense TaxID=189055 RepID=A0A9W9HPQ1_9EURO|nr:ankyrin [Penicillium canariense]KAJ5151424.1 ankyrin [Penicillium canariense]
MWSPCSLQGELTHNDEITKLLLAAGIDVNRVGLEIGGRRWRPLHSCGHPGQAQLLLEAGADPNIDREDKWGPLACVVGNFIPTVTLEFSSQEQKARRMEMVRLLFQYGADPMRAGGGWALHGALRDLDFVLAAFLADKGARINVSELTASDQRLLNQAVKDHEWGTVMRLTPLNWSFINYVGPGLINNGRFISMYRLPVSGQGSLPPWLENEIIRWLNVKLLPCHPTSGIVTICQKTLEVHRT